MAALAVATATPGGRAVPAARPAQRRAPPVTDKSLPADGTAPKAGNRQGAMITLPKPETGGRSFVIDDLFAGDATVLTAAGGLVDQGPERRKVCCLFSSGVLVVAESEYSDGNGYSRGVRSLAGAARMKQVTIERVVIVPFDVVDAINARASVSKAMVSAKSDDSLDPVAMQERVQDMLADAFRKRATDIHVTVYPERTLVEYRIDGVLRQISTMEHTEGRRFCASAHTLKADGDTQYTEDREMDARITHDSASLPADLGSVRCCWSPQYGNGRLLVMRLLPKDNSGKTVHVDSLGYLPEQIKLIEDLWCQPEGIILVSGPTGSGKSTTLKIILEALYRATRGEKSILTVEEPAEYRIIGTKQRSMANNGDGAKRSEAYANAVRAILRQDPDVALIGEIRDEQTADLAIKMASTGHLVFSTLHANSALHVISRLRGLKIREADLYDPEVFRGLIAQRLVRKLCPECKRPLKDCMDDLGDRDRNLILKAFDLEGEATLWGPCAEGTSCTKCGGVGYTGRSVVAEVLRTDDRFMEIISHDGGRSAARKYWLEDMGGLSMMDHGVRKVIAGETSPMEIIRVLGGLENRFSMDNVLTSWGESQLSA